ncbi:hypothetical protein MK805_09165 [Shimazuella sp. AN120528]|uniref:hypothetical protein n=1 Tax=Shimazuella soli TaxID=1892854 RepID=UPI001F10C60B|nr:hypothetical protein [Shimazuella soli]MCH5585138.1 hypothetical protein [Shimazuella soli]
MSMRLIVEGEECSVQRYIRDLKQDKRYRFYHIHEFLLNPVEMKVECYVERTNNRLSEDKKPLAKVIMEIPDEHGAKKIEIDLLDIKLVNLLDGKTTIFGMSYDVYAHPSRKE